MQLAGLWRGDQADWTAIAAVVCTAIGTYLVDRVKFWPTLIDPADRMAQPGRYKFLGQYDALARAVAIIALLSGAPARRATEPLGPHSHHAQRAWHGAIRADAAG